MKSKLWSLLIYSLFISTFTSQSYADESGCNPSAAICRPICGSSNDQADRHIEEYMRSLSEEQMKLSQALKNISSKGFEVTKSQQSIQFLKDRKSQLTDFFQKDLGSKEQKRIFLAQLHEILKVFFTQNIDYATVISQSNIKPVNARALGIFLDACAISLEELYNMILKTPGTNAFPEVFEFADKNLDKQLINAITENANLREEIRVMDQQIGLIRLQIEKYGQAIAQQEARKCSFSSF